MMARRIKSQYQLGTVKCTPLQKVLESIKEPSPQSQQNVPFQGQENEFVLPLEEHHHKPTQCESGACFPSAFAEILVYFVSTIKTTVTGDKGFYFLGYRDHFSFPFFFPLLVYDSQTQILCFRYFCPLEKGNITEESQTSALCYMKYILYMVKLSHNVEEEGPTHIFT